MQWPQGGRLGAVGYPRTSQQQTRCSDCTRVGACVVGGDLLVGGRAGEHRVE